MSLGLPSIKVKPVGPNDVTINEGAYGIPDVMTHGRTPIKANLGSDHPLEISEKKYAKNRAQLDMTILRNNQGLHAPLKIAMELKAINKVGHLPFLPSYNILRDSLTGRDLEIGFEDMLNTGEFREQMIHPHAVIERSLNIL